MRRNCHVARVHGRVQLQDRDQLRINSRSRDSWQACRTIDVGPLVFFNAADPKPNADFIFVRLFRVDRADQTQSQQAGGSSACVQR